VNRDDIVIVGGGLAGLRAAERLRERGFSGAITMVGEEPVAPYNRPPLSKQMLTGKMRPDELSFQTFTRLAVQFRPGRRATGLDPRSRQVHLDTGEELPYGGLIVATGVKPRVLPTAPPHDERIAMLRTLDDLRKLEGLMGSARRIAVVGGGFIGCEVAASARRRAIDVTLIDRAPVLLHRVLGPELGAVLTDVHREAGVELRLGAAIDRWSTGRGGVTLDLSDGTVVQADVVLVAIGTMPATEWLEESGVDTTDGLLCDETCHVVGLDHVVAAGDVARWPNLRFDRVPRRVEHWINAVEHGRAAADSLLDGRQRARAFAPVPRFWSEQHGMKIQSVGMPALADRIVLAQGELARREFVAAYLQGDRVVGALGFNSSRSMLKFAEVVGASNPLPVVSLVDHHAFARQRGAHHPVPPHTSSVAVGT